MQVPETSPFTILSSACLQGFWEFSRDQRLAREEGQIIVDLLKLGWLVRVWSSRRPLRDRDLIAGRPGAIVGLLRRSKSS